MILPGEQARAVLTALLDKYADEGITTVESAKVLKLKPFDQFGTPVEIINQIYCDHFIRMRFCIKSLIPTYIQLLGSSTLVRDNISDLFVSTAGQKTVNQKHIGSLVITLPPVAEQHRIVTKVDELMTICDTLKARLQEAQTTQVQLADAIVKQAVA